MYVRFSWVPRGLCLTLTLLSLSTTACALFGVGTSDTTSAQQADSQAQLRAQLESYRTQAQTGDANAVLAFAAVLAGAQSNEQAKAAYGELDWTAMNTEAEALLDQLAASGDPNAELQSVAMKAELMLVTGRAEAALATYQGLHERSPSFNSALGLLIAHQRTGVAMSDAPGFCASNRSLALGAEQTYQYMQACAALNPSSSLAESLPWASQTDLDLYARVDAEVQAEQARQQAEWEAQQQAEREANERAMADARAASSTPSSSSSSSSAPAGPTVVYVTLRNTCPSKVNLFLGDTPKFGSGTYTSIGANTSTGMSFKEGDMIWIVDDSQNGISSTTVSANARTVEITKSCTGMTSR